MSENELNELAVALADGLRAVSAQRPELAGQLLWILAEGHPVSPEQIAGVLDVSREEAIHMLRESPGVELDDEDKVTGCFGLSLAPTPHHFRLGDHELFTWCALDALFLPIVLNRSARVESSCAVTGERILVAVSPDAIQRVEPASAVLAIVVPEASEVCCDVRNAFCHKVHFFSSSETASQWVAKHKGATILTVNEAYRLGQLLLKNLFQEDRK
jgi:alkylmercury lyase